MSFMMSKKHEIYVKTSAPFSTRLHSAKLTKEMATILTRIFRFI